MAEEIKTTLEDLKTRFPRDMDYTISLDTTLPVSEGINEIVHTLFEAVVLVIIVVFVFLQNWRATLIPLLTVPVSLVGAFIFFPMLGFSINVLSLLGLVLAIGIVVDDAIVVVEAVMHHIEHGMTPKDGHVQGDGGSVGAGRGHRADPGGRVRAGRLHGRHLRPALPAVRDHDRDLGAAVGVQRADAVAGARRRCCSRQPTGKKTLLTPFYRGFNKVFGAGTNAYVDARRLPGPQAGGQRGAGRRLRVPDGPARRPHPRRVRARGGPGLHPGQRHRCPTPPRSSARDAVMRKVEKILAANEGVKGYNTITGFSLITGAYSTNMGFFFVELKEWEERHTRRDCTPTACSRR